MPAFTAYTNFSVALELLDILELDILELDKRKELDELVAGDELIALDDGRELLRLLDELRWTLLAVQTSPP